LTKRDAPRLPLHAPKDDHPSATRDTVRAEPDEGAASKKVLRVGLIALLFFTPLIFPWRIQHGEAVTYRFNSFLVPKEAVTQLAMTIMVCYWLVNAVWKGSFRFRTSPVLLPVAVLTALAGVSVLWSPTPHSSAVEFTKLATVFVFFFIVVSVFFHGREFRLGLNAIFLSGVIVSALSLIQLCGGLAHLFPRYPGNPQRMYSTFGNDSGVAGYLLPVLPVGIGLLLASGRKWAKWGYFIGLAVIGYAMLACQTRGVWLGACGALTFLLVSMLRRRELRTVLNAHRVQILLALLLAVVSVIVQSSIPGTSTGETDTLTRAKSSFVMSQPGVNLRAVFWGAALLMVADRPLFGFGLGSYTYYAQLYLGKFMVMLGPTSWLQPNDLDIETAHNDYVQLASELGVLGVGVLIWVIVVFCRSLGKPSHCLPNCTLRCLVLSAFSGLVGVAVFAATNFPFHIVTHALVFMFLLAVVTGIEGIAPSRSREWRLPGHSVSKTALSLGVTACGILFLSFVIRPYIADYHAASASLMESAEPRSDAVLDEFHKAVRWEPRNGFIRANLGRVCLQRGMITEAKRELTSSLRDYDSAWVHMNLGSACEAQGNFDEAAKHYSDAAFRAPRYGLARTLLVQALIKAGRYQEARKRFEEAARWAGDT